MTVKELEEMLDRYAPDAEVVVFDKRFGEMRVKAIAPYSTLFKGTVVEDDGDWEGGIAPNAPILLTDDVPAERNVEMYEKAVDWVCRRKR